MRLFVLGATGKTGSEILRLALKDGHAVTAFVRSPEKVSKHAALSVVKGSPADVNAMAQSMVGHDVVFSALAPQPRELLWGKREWTMAGYAANIVQAMERAGVKRLVAFTSEALFPEQGLFIRFINATLAKSHHGDLRAMEELIAATSLEWTIARPGSMSVGDSVEHRAQVGSLPREAKPMNFAGLARFMIDAGTTPNFVRQIVGVAR